MNDKVKTISFGKKAMSLSIGNILNATISVLSMMIVTRLLTQSEFATYKQTFLAFNFILPFLTLGLTEGLYYFLPNEKIRFRGRVIDCFTVYLIVGVLLSAFILFGGNSLLAARFNNPQVEELLKWLIPYAIIVLMTQTASAIFNILNKINTYIVTNIVTTFLMTLALIISIIIAPSAKTAVITMSVSRFLQGVIFIIQILRYLPKDSWIPDVESIKQIVVFSFPLGLTSMISTITAQMDGLFVSLMSKPSEYAVYAVGALEVPLIGIVVGSISTVLLPELRNEIVIGDKNRAAYLFILASKRVATIILPLMFFLFIWADEFIVIMYSEKYFAASEIFQIYLLYFFIRISYTGPILVALGKSKFLLKKTIISVLLNAALTYIFILELGPKGAAIGTIISSMIVTFYVIFIKLSSELSIPGWKLYPIKEILKVSLMSGIVSIFSKIIIANIVGISNNIATFSLGLILYSLIMLICVNTFMKKEYEWILQKIKQLR